jgi:hypothetical protein
VAGKGQGKTRLGRSFVETVPTLSVSVTIANRVIEFVSFRRVNWRFCRACVLSIQLCERVRGLFLQYQLVPSSRVGSSAVAFQISMLLGRIQVLKLLHSRGASGHCAVRDIIHALASNSHWLAGYGIRHET